MDVMLDTNNLTILLSDLEAPLSPPCDSGSWVTRCFARQHHILPLGHTEVSAGARGEDAGRLHHVQVGQLTHHGVGVDLTHVEARIMTLHTGNLQWPLIGLRVGDLDAMVLGDDMFIEG